MSVATWVGQTMPWRGPRPGRAKGRCGRPVAPLRPPSGLCLRFGKIGTSAFCFTQLREYFLYNFSEIQKQQKTGNWHCGILLTG